MRVSDEIRFEASNGYTDDYDSSPTCVQGQEWKVTQTQKQRKNTCLPIICPLCESVPDGTCP